MSEPREEIERYLRSGIHDPYFAAWADDVTARGRQGRAALKRALINAVESRAEGRAAPTKVSDMDLVAFTRCKVEPMVRGLFPRDEQEQVLGVLERSVVYLTPETIRRVLEDAVWLHSAWALANLYLCSLDAELLSDEAPRLVGLSEETTCYVSLDLLGEKDRFADYIVHEAAHVFHNCKRGTIGLQETTRREWLLDIAFRKRETFAYCCEAYSRILELSTRTEARCRLVEELAGGSTPSDERIDLVEYVDILRDAASARNGWKRILARCAPTRRRQRLDGADEPPKPMRAMLADGRSVTRTQTT